MRLTSDCDTAVINEATKLPGKLTIDGVDFDIVEWTVTLSPREFVDITATFAAYVQSVDVGEIVLPDGRILHPYEWVAKIDVPTNRTVVKASFRVEIPESPQ